MGYRGKIVLVFLGCILGLSLPMDHECHVVLSSPEDFSCSSDYSDFPLIHTWPVLIALFLYCSRFPAAFQCPLTLRVLDARSDRKEVRNLNP